MTAPSDGGDPETDGAAGAASGAPSAKSGWGPATRAVHAGRDLRGSERAVPPPIQRGSTLLFETVAAYDGPGRTYGLEGFATHRALADALSDLAGAAGAQLAPSGLAACTTALMVFARAGGTQLVVDTVYGPTRRFCDQVLARLGVETRYFDPGIGAGVLDLVDERTCSIFLESPGSLTFELQDIPAIAAAARARRVPTIIDDTWSASVYFKPLALGVDLSVQALTKYQAGHADVLLGAIIARDASLDERVRATIKALGAGPGSAEDAWLTLRGLRTMHLRLQHQSQAALEIAAWLEQRAEVARVLHPALPSHPDHALWARDFTGSSGVFSFVLDGGGPQQATRFLEALDLFGIGASWGGFESLAAPCDKSLRRTARPWRAEGPLIRLSIGLEDPADLRADLEKGFAALAAGSPSR